MEGKQVRTMKREPENGKIEVNFILDLPPEAHRAFKAYCKRLGVPMKTILEAFIEQTVKANP